MSKNIIIFSILGFVGLLLLHKDNLYVAKSKIHDFGLFVNKSYKKGEEILMVIDNNKNITKLARKINHSNDANTIIRKKNDGWYIYAMLDIKKDNELTINYNDTPDFIAKPDPNWVIY